MREMVFHSIFIDLIKSYNDIDKDHCLDILSGYGVGPRTLRILQTYWVWIQMASKAGGQYGPVFQSHRRVTQGFPLSPIIFNVDVDTIIRHWTTVVGYSQGGAGQGLGKSIQTLLALFYADDGLVAPI